MARSTHLYTIKYVATMIGENLELLEEIAANSDNIDYGEMIYVDDGTDEASPLSRTMASKASNNSLPMSAAGKEAFAHS